MWKRILLALVCQAAVTQAYSTWSYLDVADLGTAINVFDPTIYDDFSMRLVWKNGTNENIFRETKSVIFNSSNLIAKGYGLTLIPRKNPFKFIGTRVVRVCEDLEQLFEAYFRDIKVEGVDRSWRLFTRNWSQEDIAARFGLQRYYVTGNYSYVLVKSSLEQYQAHLLTKREDLRLNDDVENDLDKINYKGKITIRDFVKKYGSHYIQSVSTGGVLYQVFVFRRGQFQFLSNQLRERPRTMHPPVEEMSTQQLNYLSPMYSLHIGKIMSVDGNSATEEWAKESCTRTLFIPYQNLYYLHENRDVLQEFQQKFKNQAVVKLNLISIADVSRNSIHRDSFAKKVYDVHSTSLFRETIETMKMMGKAVVKIFAPFVFKLGNNTT